MTSTPSQPTARSSEPVRPTGHSYRSGADPGLPGTTPPRRRDLRRLWRSVLAVLLPLGPLFVAVAFALRPYGSSDDPTAIVTKILASPSTDLLLWLGFLAPGLLLLATVTAGHLARRGAPVLATVATSINALAFGLMSGAVASGDLITVAGGRAGVDPATILTITDAIDTSPVTAIALGIWVPGHIVGMVLLAVALRRARVLPRWAAIVLGISQPVHFVAFVVLQNQYVDAFAGWGFTAIGFTAVAVALLRTRDDDWDLRPTTR
jgi:putative effector of murein hydrolase LrgA (UPF0299 family)